MDTLVDECPHGLPPQFCGACNPEGITPPENVTLAESMARCEAAVKAGERAKAGTCMYCKMSFADYPSYVVKGEPWCAGCGREKMR